VRASDRGPVSGVELVLWFGERFAEAATYANGCFEVEPALEGGAVRVWHRGNRPEPTLAEHLEVEPETLLLPALAPGLDFEEVELVLLDPPCFLEVEVVRASGAPRRRAHLRRRAPAGHDRRRRPGPDRGRRLAGELRVQAGGYQEGLFAPREWLTELGDGFLWLARAPLGPEDPSPVRSSAEEDPRGR
jgi:hypothetical protein